MVCQDHQKQVELLSGVRAAVTKLGIHSYQRQILCAEGYRDTRDYLVIWLGLAGYEVTPGDTIAECVAMATNRRFDLYLIGDRFLDGSGFDLAETIRSFDRHTPLVFHSAAALKRLNAG